MAKAATKRKVAIRRKAAKLAAPSTRRQRTVDIPSISRSAIHSSVSENRTPGGLVSKVAPLATPAPHLLTGVPYSYAVFRSDGDGAPDFDRDPEGVYETEDEAFKYAEECARKAVDEDDCSGDDEEEFFIVQVIGKVRAVKPEARATTTVFRVGGPV